MTREEIFAMFEEADLMNGTKEIDVGTNFGGSPKRLVIFIKPSKIRIIPVAVPDYVQRMALNSIIHDRSTTVDEKALQAYRDVESDVDRFDITTNSNFDLRWFAEAVHRSGATITIL